MRQLTEGECKRWGQEADTTVNLLIRIDKSLLGCTFLYIQRGPLPVMYPLCSLKPNMYGQDKFDGSLGRVSFAIENAPVKVSFNPDEIAKTVLDFLNQVKRDAA